MNQYVHTDLKAPSTTITAATLAGMGATLGVEILLQVGVDLRPTLCAAFVTFISALVGYFVREQRYGWGDERDKFRQDAAR